MRSLFVPGWGAPASLYAPLLPEGWSALEPPSFAASGGTLGAYRAWLRRELSHQGRSVVGGHSMGGALALLAAAGDPSLVERLVLVSPAGLPLTKPIGRSASDLVHQLVRGFYPRRPALAGARALLRAPVSALRLAREVRSLDLRRECRRVRDHGVRTLVVGCTSDSLVRSEQSEALARLLGAEYLELAAPGGHMWMLRERSRMAEILAM